MKTTKTVKECSKCLETLPISQFWIRPNGYSHSYCNECVRLINGSARERNRKFIDDYLRTHHCVDCGESDPIVLDFDHVRGVKRAAVTRMANTTFSISEIKKEIAKCDIRCANCHRRRTFAKHHEAKQKEPPKQ